jgi:hypothetical protein
MTEGLENFCDAVGCERPGRIATPAGRLCSTCAFHLTRREGKGRTMSSPEQFGEVSR